MLMVNEQGITVKVPSPTMEELDVKVLECKQERKSAILRIRREERP